MGDVSVVYGLSWNNNEWIEKVEMTKEEFAKKVTVLRKNIKETILLQIIKEGIENYEPADAIILTALLTLYCEIGLTMYEPKLFINGLKVMIESLEISM